MTYLTLALLLVCGCFRSGLAELSGGYARSWSGEEDGFQVRLAGGVGEGSDGGGGVQLAARTGDTSSEVAIGMHAYGAGATGPLAMFGRLTVNLLEWDRIGTDDNIGLFGPAVQYGITGRNGGPCLVVSASRDVRINYDDETYVGVSIGACAVHIDKRPRRWGLF
jgi:hypothetical protein